LYQKQFTSFRVSDYCLTPNDQLFSSTNANLLVFDLTRLGFESGSTTLEASTLTTTPSRRYSQVPDMTFLASIDVMLTLLTIYVICIWLRKVVSNTYCNAYLFFLLSSILPVSLDCPLLIGYVVVSNIALPYVQYLYI
jgi:hypothetical protein